MSEKEWLQNNRYYYQIDDTKLQSIFYFSLIWNLFEKELCAKDGNIRVHPEQHSTQYAEKINQELLSQVFDYFQDRYALNGSKTQKYESFEFKSEDIKNEVFENLTIDKPTVKQKLKAILLIAFRLRNNLFHGEKQVEMLYEQNENFAQVNLLLTHLIDIT